MPTRRSGYADPIKCQNSEIGEEKPLENGNTLNSSAPHQHVGGETGRILADVVEGLKGQLYAHRHTLRVGRQMLIVGAVKDRVDHTLRVNGHHLQAALFHPQYLLRRLIIILLLFLPRRLSDAVLALLLVFVLVAIFALLVDVFLK